MKSYLICFIAFAICCFLPYTQQRGGSKMSAAGSRALSDYYSKYCGVMPCFFVWLLAIVIGSTAFVLLFYAMWSFRQKRRGGLTVCFRGASGRYFGQPRSSNGETSATRYDLLIKPPPSYSEVITSNTVWNQNGFNRTV